MQALPYNPRFVFPGYLEDEAYMTQVAQLIAGITECWVLQWYSSLWGHGHQHPPADSTARLETTDTPKQSLP